VRHASAAWQPRLAVGTAGILFAGVALLPLLWPLLALPGQTADEVFRNIAMFSSPQPWLLLLRSLALSAAVVIGALLVGVPTGLLLARTDIMGRRVLLMAHAFPMFLPPFLLALGWFYLFGRQGYFGGEFSSALLFGPVGHLLTLSFAFAPIVTALLALSLWNLDPSLEEAARVVARPMRVAVGILVPAAWPSIALAAMIVFALAFSELGVAMFLRIDVYPAAVFSRLGGVGYDPSAAFLLALPLLPVALALLAIEQWVFRRRPFDVLGLRHRAHAPLALGAWRGVLSVVLWTMTAVSLLPLIGLIVKAGNGEGFAQISRWIGASLVNSLVGSALAASVIVGLGIVLGYGSARRVPGARLLDAVGILAFFVPAVLLGAGLIALWNRPLTQSIYVGVGILVLGYVARYGIVGIRTVAMAVAQRPVSLEHAAACFGAGFIRRFAAIVIPLHWRALGAAWLLAVVFCLRDLETAVLYYPPGLEPLTVRIFTLEANGPEAVVAGLAVLHLVLTACVLTIGALLLFGEDRKRR
jgi:iron(III) transport system permease protein